jgi:elongation factor P--(R)-beta-lysine ligase
MGPSVYNINMPSAPRGPTYRRIQDPRRQRGTAARRAVTAAIREFFDGRGFLEVQTPVVVPCPGMEPHIRPFAVAPLGEPGDGAAPLFLQTSPEFAMKRLLVGGMERIYQLAPVFRAEPRAPTHLPEFTMLEWYRAGVGYEQIMGDTEELVAWVAERVCGTTRVPWRGRTVDVAPPWPRLRVRDLFAEHAGFEPTPGADLAGHAARLGVRAAAGDGWDDLYFRIWLEVVEPRLPDRAVFVIRYPASQAALSVVDQDADGTSWARRFEAYAGGLELANAFEELTDPVEQRRRFVADMELRRATYGDSFPTVPLPEELLGALEEGMPPAGGIALGVDRLVMLCADEADIAFTTWL